MTSVWIITGAIGEYSDRSFWIVASFWTAEAAERYRAALQEDARRIVGTIKDAWDGGEPLPVCPEWAKNCEVDPDRLDQKWDTLYGGQAPVYTVQEIPHDQWEHLR